MALDGTGSVRGRDRDSPSSTTCCRSSAATAGSTSRSRPPATSTSTPTTPWRTSASCSGEALAEALGDKAGIRRFASIALPLDEALVEVALDISGRPYLAYDVTFGPDVAPLGSPPFDPQLAEEFWRAFVTAAGDHPAPAPRDREEHPPRPRGVVQGSGALPARRACASKAGACPRPKARWAPPTES